MAQAKDVTRNITLCVNNSLVSAEEIPPTHTRLIPFVQAAHSGLIDAAHSY